MWKRGNKKNMACLLVGGPSPLADATMNFSLKALLIEKEKNSK